MNQTTKRIPHPHAPRTTLLIAGILGLAMAVLLGVPGMAAPVYGSGWEHDHRATQDTTGGGQNETAIAVNPQNRDNAIVVTKDYRDPTNVRNYIDITTDGGSTWHEQPFPLPDPSVPTYTDPYVFFRPDGRAYVVWTSFSDFSHGGLYTAWSDDGGMTWSAPSNITPPDGHFDDKSWLAFDNTGGPRQGIMYAFWTRFGSAEIFSAHSTDSGVTWSPAVQVSGGVYASNDDGAQPMVMPDGSVTVIFMHDTADPSVGTLVLTRSTDGGATFGPGTPLFDISKPPFRLPGEDWHIYTYHTLVRDPVRGWLTLIWADYREGAANGIDILTSRSANAGSTWTQPERLNDDPPGLVRDQWFPMLVASPDGRLTALWLDRRDDPNNRLYYAYARTSTDGGLNWQPSVRISSVPSDPNVNIPPDADGIGDYIGLAAGPDSVWASWVDTRNGDQDIYAARELFTPQPTPTATPAATPTLCAEDFSDVSPSDYFYAGVSYLWCQGAISGYAGNTFRPYNSTTRGQMAKIVVLAERFPFNTQGGPHFRDVVPGSAFYEYVETAYNRGLVSGYSCGQGCLEYRPGANVTRAQICKLVVNAEGWPIDTSGGPHFSDVALVDPFYGFIETAHSHGIVTGYGDGTFRPGNSATRGQVSKVVYRALAVPH